MSKDRQRNSDRLREHSKSEKLERKQKRKINSQVMTTTILFALIFFSMIGYYAYFIVFDSQEVVNNSYNKRIDSYAETVIRGTIYSRNHKELAVTNTDDQGNETREYPYDKLFSHVVGIKNHGKSGLEKLCNFNLLYSNASPMQKIVNDFMDVKENGDNIVTTLSVKLQKAAYNSLGDNDGAVVICDPKTGEILAMVSKPAYNPNTIDKIWDKLAEDTSDSRLVNRATQGKYTPGSIFKVVTTLEYMRENKKHNDFSYYCNGKATFGKNSIRCFDGHSHYSEDLTDAFAYSCNSAFSTIGSKLNMTKFKTTADDLLFNSKLPIEIEYNQSVFDLNKDSSMFDITQTSIGQGKTLVTPMHMSMIASTIANNGVLIKPHLIRQIENSDGEIVEEYGSEKYADLMTLNEAKQLQKYMRSVVEYGTGKVMAYSGYKAYGKTGTAEISSKDNINSWFIGYATLKKKKIAIAVVIEDVPEGSSSAVNCAKSIFDTYFE